MPETKKLILDELKHHAPFTVLGALTGIIIMAFLYKMPHKAAYNAFYVFHPLHVILSALVSASMYRNHKCPTDIKKCKHWPMIAIGFFGAIGIATLSDSVMPFLGEKLLGMPHAEAHIGFIEKWYLVLPLAAVGVGIAFYRPSTKFPHAGHVLISTWASLFHVIMAIGQSLSWVYYVGIFVFLFLAVWLPCCISDIVFPLLFVGKIEE